MTRVYLLLISIFLFNLSAQAQNGVLKGRVFNALNNEPIPFATVVIKGTTNGAQTDDNGIYKFEKLAPGIIAVEVSVIGFKKKTVPEVQITNAQPAILDFALEEETSQLTEVEITATGFNKREEAPLSLRTLSISEIERNPGSNRDISNVIRSLPGVASTPAFRNDIIIRGGAPNENRFYLDGVEVPNINHFATQGSSGGPVGLINVNFIREVDYFSGAFPSARGNALSSVFEFKQKDGRNDKQGFTLTSGATDFGFTAEGPMSKKTTYIASVRRSYLQFLFKALQLPFLPIYNDFQFKIKHQFNEKNELTVIGLGAIDNNELNLEANETESQRYILNYLPSQEQWNYTNGYVFKHFGEKGYHTFVFSRSMLNNTSMKYKNNDESLSSNLILNYKSQEIENKFRYENNLKAGSFKITYGVNYEYAKYNNNTFNQIVVPSGNFLINYSSAFNMHKYGAFGQISKPVLKERLMLSLGIRTDANNLNASMKNPLNQFSPRFSVSYSVNEHFTVNANVGRYFQLPAYTILGYKDANSTFANQTTTRYIQSNHLVTGVAYETTTNAKFTLEGFYKSYNHYPFLTTDSISLANLGGDFGVIGNAPAVSSSTGRSYGIEFLAQQKLIKGFFGILAYTFVMSEFKDKNNQYVPTAWDSRNIVNLTLGKKFTKNWQTGIKFRYSGGQPYTPYNLDLSATKSVWDVTGRGIPDYNQLNTLRLAPFHGLDIRIDKFFYLNKITIDLYADIQNLYNFKAEQPPIFNVSKNDKGLALTNPNNPWQYQYYLLNSTTGTVLPTIGVKIDF